MTPEEISENKVWWLLQEIRREMLIQCYASICVVKINFDKLIKKDPSAPSIEDIRHLVRSQLTIRLKIFEIIETNHDKWYDSTSFTLQIAIKKFNKLYEEYASKFPNDSNEKVLRYRSLELDLVKGKIRYLDHKPVELKINQKNIKFLILLLRNRRILEYTEIAKELKLNCWKEDASNEDVSHEVNSIKKDLVNFLKNSVKLSDSEIQKMIISKAKIGYKLAD